MRTWQEESKREQAKENIKFNLFALGMSIIATTVVYYFTGMWKPVLIGCLLGFGLIALFPLICKLLDVTTKFICNYLDKKWENWWKYL